MGRAEGAVWQRGWRSDGRQARAQHLLGMSGMDPSEKLTWTGSLSASQRGWSAAVLGSAEESETQRWDVTG